ncbi:MAG: heavy-metal-associated domain-containing protein [Saprospirales bacterium]|nr:heavy-metal-associated domain-containing protein [Saprospirales bacterium]MBK8920026.1 heavy-metal-associated domain-containing protein [Saprospirales bacterium]
MLKIAILALFTGVFPVLLNAQSTLVKKSAQSAAEEKTETFQVVGNCGMCKSKIEKAALGAGVTKANWDTDTDQLSITFDPAKVSTDAVQQAIARVGYDNAGYKAPDEAYDGLHGCCKYDRSERPETAKPLPAATAPKQ